MEAIGVTGRPGPDFPPGREIQMATDLTEINVADSASTDTLGVMSFVGQTSRLCRVVRRN